MGGYGGRPSRCAGTRGPDPGHRCARGGQCAWPAGWRARETRRAGECSRRGGRGGQLEEAAGCVRRGDGGRPPAEDTPPQAAGARDRLCCAPPPPLHSGGAASFCSHSSGRKSQPRPRASSPRRTLVSGSMKWAQLACRVLVKRGGEEDVVSEAGMGLRKQSVPPSESLQ